MTKAKSHRAFEDARDLYDLWYVAANMCADIAANAAYMSIPSEIRQLSDTIVDHMESEASRLHDHLKFLAAFNKKRCQLLDEKGRNDTSNLIRPRQAHNRSDGLFNSSLMGFEACEAMTNFSTDTYESLPKIEVTDDTFHACLQGANIAKAFVFGVGV